MCSVNHHRAFEGVLAPVAPSNPPSALHRRVLVPVPAARICTGLPRPSSGLLLAAGSAPWSLPPAPWLQRCVLARVPATSLSPALVRIATHCSASVWAPTAGPAVPLLQAHLRLQSSLAGALALQEVSRACMRGCWVTWPPGTGTTLPHTSGSWDACTCRWPCHLVPSPFPGSRLSAPFFRSFCRMAFLFH